VKHRFLLDFNIIYHAVRGVDKYDNPDQTCAELLCLIGQNCHKIVVNEYLIGEYLKRIYNLYNTIAPALPPIYFIQQLLFKAEKFSQEIGELPTIPPGVDLPREDIEIVRSALVSRPILVAADEPLCEAVNNNVGLGLRAQSPELALVLARDT
jgi:hypothetical protein